ncbi:glycosyltransferase family 4 protein [Georgenia yuyongxinii]|uniref:Glycosyltransferase family 4 protein n=1 Tax=Georgenia yuyongxinii TaxID=2589797 RepID=A0A5B8C2N2_9MICO|nr:glycosyltransferase family 4 protein [Georgenia yuyongxinii]QDC24397.1 glycosyltransferase family 4 protein [Georgenia yuyongxinii]
MRVLQLTGSSAGGVGRHAREVAALLGADGPVVLAGPADVVTPAGPGESGAGKVRAVVVDIADRPRPRDASAVRQVRRLAAGADVVHAHGLRAGALAVLAVRSLGRRRPRLVVTVHNLPVGGPRVRAVAAVLETLVARGADAVLGVSGDLVERMRARGAREVERALVPAPERPASTVPAEQLREGLGLASGERLVLTVARLAPQKGLDLLADAAAILAGSDAGPGAGLGAGRGAGPDAAAPTGRHAEERTEDGARRTGWRWVVVGDGPLREALARRARTEDLPILLTGRRDDVPDLLAAADAVVSTATWEGQPIAVQEALRAGAALVATDVGGTREVTGDAAVLVPAGDAPALAAAIRAVLSDDGRRAALRVAALERAAVLPGPADVLAQLQKVYGGLG